MKWNTTIYTSNDFGVMTFWFTAGIQGEYLTVDFPEQTNWTGVASEMDLINSDVSGNLKEIRTLLNKFLQKTNAIKADG